MSEGNAGSQHVTVTNIQMPLVKWAIAAIPALVILGLFWILVGGLFFGVLRH
jgi:hypothetical protein